MKKKKLEDRIAELEAEVEFYRDVNKRWNAYCEDIKKEDKILKLKLDYFKKFFELIKDRISDLYF